MAKAVGRQGEFDAIPMVDVGGLFDGDAGMAEVAQEIGHAYANVGFAYIVNHGVSQSLINSLFDASAAFHALPLAEKMEIELNEFHRGFIPINTSTPRTSSIARVTRPNQSESFIMMHELPADDPDVLAGLPLAGPNQWPRSLPQFRDTVLAYSNAMTELARRMVQAMAVALGQNKDAFDADFSKPTTFLRLLYYPPRNVQDPDDLFGSAPHTDYGFVTMLAQDKTGGLQVRNVAGEWIDAPPLEGSFVMNVGDALHRWSNGRFISTPHRVINRSGHARYSCPFFFDPHVHSCITPFETCVAEDQPRSFDAVIYGEYLMARLKANHDQHADRA